ncbi:MAG: hypothetical protein LBL75_00400 [Rickettsiales bacterium]|jgi:hypothetical protein|nr:hypothetical protein [Rickettsiales bacterium]
MIIGFTHSGRSIPARLFCRRFRHCAIIIKVQISDCKYDYVMFVVGGGRVSPVFLRARDLKILVSYGWVFVNVPSAGFKVQMLSVRSPRSCVSFAKRALGIRAPFVITPEGLYKKIQCNSSAMNQHNTDIKIPAPWGGGIIL